MSVEFSDAAHQYTGSITAITKPWTIVCYVSSSDNTGTQRWAVQSSGGDREFRAGVYAQGIAQYRGSVQTADIGLLTTTPYPFVWQCEPTSTIQTLSAWTDNGASAIGELDGGSSTFGFGPDLVLNYDAYHSNGNKIAMLAVYAGAMANTQAFLDQVYARMHPRYIFPDNLRHLWEFIRPAATIPDIVGGVNLTQASSPTAAAHPRVFLPRLNKNVIVPAASGVTETPSPIAATASVVTPATVAAGSIAAVGTTSSVVGVTTLLLQAGSPISTTFGVVTPSTTGVIAQDANVVTSAVASASHALGSNPDAVVVTGSVITPGTTGAIAETPDAIGSTASVVSPTVTLVDSLAAIAIQSQVVSSSQSIGSSQASIEVGGSVVTPSTALLRAQDAIAATFTVVTPSTFQEIVEQPTPQTTTGAVVTPGTALAQAASPIVATYTVPSATTSGDTAPPIVDIGIDFDRPIDFDLRFSQTINLALAYSHQRDIALRF